MLHLGAPDATRFERAAAAAARHVERHVRPDELHQVLVTGHDHDLVRPGGEAAGERGDHVVGFHPLDFDTAQTEGLDDAADVWQLGHEGVGHRIAIRLVVVGELVAKRRPAGVEYDRHALGLLFGHQLEQHVHHAEHGVRRQAVFGGEHRYRMERPEDVRADVHEVEPRHGFANE